MIKLLRFEFYKLIKQKSLYICGGVMLALILLNTALTKLIASQDYIDFGIEFNYSGAGLMLTSISNASFTLIWSIFIVLFACGDYGNQTIKNVYSRGYSKTQVYFAKYIVSMVSTVAVFILIVLFGLATGCAFFPNGTPESANYAGLIFGQFFTCIAYISMIFAISLMLRRTGVAMAIAIVGPTAVTLLLSVVDVLLKLDTFLLSEYWLEGMLTVLADPTTKLKKILIDMAISVVYAALFTVAGWLVNRTRDV